jgi:hypothetical protein
MLEPGGLDPENTSVAPRNIPCASLSRVTVLHASPAGNANAPQRESAAARWFTPHGADGNRTHDPLLAKQVLSQLSYRPEGVKI